MRSLLTVASALALLSFASSALAVEPAPGQAAAAPPAPTAVPITATCSLGEHTGLDEAEAKTAADIVCHELAKRGATNTNHELRFGKLGGRTLVVLAARSGNEYNEARTFIQSLDEIDVAGPRLVSSLLENKPMAETRTVDNVISNEQRTPKQAGGSVTAVMGMYGLSSVGAASAASAGFDVGIGYRSGHFGLQADGRLGGIGSGETKIGNASLDVGGRFYVTDGDIAPFAGGGFEVSYFKRNGSDDEGDGKPAALSGSGAGAFASIGVEALRSHHVGLVVAGRIDMPFYSLEGERYGSSTCNYQMTSGYNCTSSSSGPKHESAYVMPVSLTVALVFH